MDENKITMLEGKIQELENKVNDLYSITGFPEPVLEALRRRGFVRIDKTLLTPFTTTDGYDSKYYYMFSKIDDKDVVFSNIAAKDFTTIQSIDTGTDTFTSNNHGLNNGDVLTFWSTTTPPEPITNGQTVYVINSATNTFELSDTLGGSAINITDTGTGTHYLQRINIIA